MPLSSFTLYSLFFTCYLLFHCFQLVGSFQYEAQVKQQECDTTQKKLSDVRKLIAKLLKSINEVKSIKRVLLNLYCI